MSTHTPGPKLPLKVVYNTDYLYEPNAEEVTNRYVQSVEDADGKTICYTDAGYFKMQHAEWIVQVCNTAPAMLEALKRAQDHLLMSEGHFLCEGKIGQSRDWKEAVAEVRAAIAQAEGKETRTDV